MSESIELSWVARQKTVFLQGANQLWLMIAMLTEWTFSCDQIVDLKLWEICAKLWGVNVQNCILVGSRCCIMAMRLFNTWLLFVIIAPKRHNCNPSAHVPPDIVPEDLFLFTKLKRPLKCQTFDKVKKTAGESEQLSEDDFLILFMQFSFFPFENSNPDTEKWFKSIFTYFHVSETF